MRKCGLAITLLLLVMVSAGAQVPVVGGNGVTLKDIAGTETLVTLVLNYKGTQAEEPNLHILKLYDTYLATVNTSGARGAFVYDDIKEIRVQGGQIETGRLEYLESNVLSTRQEAIVMQAFERINAIYQNSNTRQDVKMDCAALVAMSGEAEASRYLRMLATSNDLSIAIDAALRLYWIGDTETAAERVTAGVYSGDRALKSRAAFTAGLYGDREVVPELLSMLQSRSSELFISAALALGQLQESDALPLLLDALSDLKKDRAEAAAEALILMGGPDVIKGVWDEMDALHGETEYRGLRVLYALGDPQAERVLREDIMRVPSLAREAALLLAANGDWDAIDYLNTALEKRYDPNIRSLTYRARVAAALIKGGDAPAISIMQELLRIQPDDILDGSDQERQATVNMVKIVACDQITGIGKRRMLNILQPLLKEPNEMVAMAACEAAIATAMDDFRVRLLETRR